MINLIIYIRSIRTKMMLLKIIKVICLYTLFITLSIEKCHGNSDYLIEKKVREGNYENVIKLLNNQCRTDSINKNWRQWIFHKKQLASYNSNFLNLDAITNIIDACKEVIKQQKISDPYFLASYQLIVSKYSIINSETKKALKYAQMSYRNAVKSNVFKPYDLVEIYYAFYDCYREQYDYANTQIYVQKMKEIVKKYHSTVPLNELNLAYLTFIDLNVFKIQNGEIDSIPQLIIDTENYFQNGLKFAGSNPIFRVKMYFFLAYFYHTLFISTNKPEFLTKSSIFYGKAIEFVDKNYKETTKLKINCLYGKAHLLKNNYPNISLLYCNSIINLLQSPQIESDRNYSNNNIQLFPSKNDYLNVSIYSLKIQILKELYKKTKNHKYEKDVFKAACNSSKICIRIIEQYDSDSPLKSLRNYRITPFEEGIKFAYSLYNKTRHRHYKEKIFEFAENNKYSDIIKSYLNSKNETHFGQRKSQSPKIKNLSISQVQNNLEENSCLIEYAFDSEDNLYAIFFTKKKYDVIKIKVNSSDLNAKITVLHQLIHDSNIVEYAQLSSEVYGILLAPILKKIPSRINKLVIVPDRIISIVPFDALLYSCQKKEIKDYRKLPYLIKKYRVTQLLSVRVKNYLQNNNNNLVTNQILGFSPGNIGKMNKLPYALKSLKYLEKKYDGNFLYNKSASVKAFMKKSPFFSVIYISSHAQGNFKNSNDSEIFLHHSKNDRSLTLEDIYHLNLNSDLVVLSACQTGIGEYQYSEGIMSFERAFIFAGSKSIISTLWQIDDKANFEMLKKFINNLDKNQKKSYALYNAKLDFLNSAKTSEDANPLYWASYKLTGSDSKLKLERRSQITSRYLFLFIGGIIVVFFLYKENKKI